MGFIEFLLFLGIVLAISWFAVWILGYFLPGHPEIFDKLIWGVAIVIVILKLAVAVGLIGADPQIPHIIS